MAILNTATDAITDAVAYQRKRYVDLLTDLHDMPRATATDRRERAYVLHAADKCLQRIDEMLNPRECERRAAAWLA